MMFLEEYRIGVITDNIAIQYLLDIGVNQSPVVPESNVSSIIGALDNGEIDLWACPETAGRYFTEQATGWEEYVYMNPVQANLYYKTTYYRLVTGKPDRQQL